MLNLFLALLLNAFDNGDDEEDGNDDENDKEGEDEENMFKRILGKLTHTKTTSVFPVPNSPLANGSCSSSQEIQTTLKKPNMEKEYLTVGKCPSGGRGGGTQKLLHGEALPRGLDLTLSYTIFCRNGTPFIFHIPSI